ncbi:MAG: hypothetical protein IRY90_09370 [Actinomadura rubrobrunea]|nr:hypothetical protein [Actinomadura rubrobrunea]
MYVFVGMPQPFATAVVYLGFAVAALGCAYFVVRRRSQVLSHCVLVAVGGVALGAWLMEVLPQARLAADGADHTAGP